MKRVFIDMDNVLVDFQSGLDQVSEEVKAEYAGRLDEIPGLFAKMKPMEGAIEAQSSYPTGRVCSNICCQRRRSKV